MRRDLYFITTAMGEESGWLGFTPLIAQMLLCVLFASYIRITVTFVQRSARVRFPDNANVLRYLNLLLFTGFTIRSDTIFC